MLVVHLASAGTAWIARELLDTADYSSGVNWSMTSVIERIGRARRSLKELGGVPVPADCPHTIEELRCCPP